MRINHVLTEGKNSERKLRILRLNLPSENTFKGLVLGKHIVVLLTISSVEIWALLGLTCPKTDN